jgi:hypothetical protein
MRLAPEIESAAYLCGLEALRAAAGHWSVAIRKDGDWLTISGPVAAATVMRDLADRVEALDGCLRSEGGLFFARLPCPGVSDPVVDGPSLLKSA